jgi:hypothetical protein
MVEPKQKLDELSARELQRIVARNALEGRAASGAKQMRANLKRGFFRLWLIASALWAAFCLYRADMPCRLNYTRDVRLWCAAPRSPPEPQVGFIHEGPSFFVNPEGTSLSIVLVFAFGVPLMVIVAGLTATWVLRGFAYDDEDEFRQ